MNERDRVQQDLEELLGQFKGSTLTPDVRLQIGQEVESFLRARGLWSGGPDFDELMDELHKICDSWDEETCVNPIVTSDRLCQEADSRARVSPC